MRPGTTNDQALVKVGDQGRAQGAALFSRLEGQVYDANVVYFTSTQGGATPSRTGAPDDEAPPNDDNLSGFGKGNGQVWAYHCRSQKLQVLFQAPVDDAEANLTFDFPDNITTSAAGRSSSARTARSTTTSAGCPAAASSGTSPSTGSSASCAGANGSATSSRVDVLPRRPHVVRQHPGQPRHDVRDLGPLGADRGLASACGGRSSLCRH